MSKSSLLKKNKKTLTPVPQRHEKIYKYLRKSKDSKTLTQISKATDIPISSVRRILNELTGNERKYEYSNIYYTIVYESGGYKVLKEPKYPLRYHYNDDVDDKDTELKQRRSSYITDLINKKVVTSSEAENLTQTVILYKTTKDSRLVLERMLRSLFIDKLHDIVPCNNGLYIILKESDDLEYVRKDVHKFYTDLVASKKISKESRRAAKSPKKEDNIDEGS